MKKSLGIIMMIVVAMALVVGTIEAGPRKKRQLQPRTAGTVRQERSRTSQEIENTRRDINLNTSRTRKKINALRSIEADIAVSKRKIDTLNTNLDSINVRLQLLTDTLEMTCERLKQQREKYAEGLRNGRRMRQSLNPSLYIFSSKDFNETWRRLRFLNEMTLWRASETLRLKTGVDTLAARRQRFESVMRERTEKLNELQAARDVLDGRRQQTARLVAELKTRGAELKKVLAQKQRHMKDLDRELDKIIAEEERKAREARQRAEEEARRRRQQQATDQTTSPGTNPSTAARTSGNGSQPEPLTSVAQESRRLTGGFTQNKGRLLFPVAGRYKIVGNFGRNKHAELKNIEVNNNGIDIEVTPGTNARAVFDGEVSAAFRVNGYDNVVMLRHGSYLTVYAGLSELMVRKGQKVRAGVPVGRIASDSEDDNRTVLHFEIRKEREKLNPLEWVR